MNANYFPFNISMKIFGASRFVLVCFFFISFYSYGQRGIYHSSNTLEVPAGVGTLSFPISIKTWGGGGGGGGTTALISVPLLGINVTILSAGGGGGGGAYNQGEVNNVGESDNNIYIPFTVGTGGASSLSGGKTFFPTLSPVVSANGGAGGSNGTLLSPYGGGGSGGAVVSGGFPGGAGNSASLLGTSLTLVSGGGGGGAGSTNAGLPSTNGLLVKPGGLGGSGVVGNEIGGKGGDGKLSLSSSGEDGVAPGGGGGGGFVLADLGANVKGGKGGDGQLKVNYTCPTYGITSFSTDASCLGTVVIKVFGNLPIGKYTVTYNRSLPLATGLTYIMKVSKANEGEIIVSGLPTTGSSVITIKELKSVDCVTPVDFSITFDRPSVPIKGLVTNPTCAIPTGSVVLSGLSTLSNWIITALPITVGLTGLTGTGGTTTITGLTPGTTYSFVVSHGGCASTTLTNVGIGSLPPTRTWSGSSWDVTPTIENKVVFATSYTKDESVEACSCQVNSTAHVTIKTGRYLKIRNELVVSPSGSLTFENNASLVQVNNTNNNSGKISYHRHTSLVKRYDFTYWSSPVVDQTLYNLSPNTLGDKYYSYDPDLGWVIHYNGNQKMLTGIGYIIRAPQSFEIDVAKIDDNPLFIGEPNNGVKTLSGLIAGKSYLLGNPYPSPLDANQFLSVNSSVLEGTLYFWAHNSSPAAATIADGKYYYTANDYASYNITGGVGIAASTDTSNPAKVPTGKIASGQGFFAPVKANGAIQFNNDMRLFSMTTIMDNSQFFKVNPSAKGSTVISVEKNRVWLNLTNTEGAFKQTLVGYITGATNDYEGRFDGESYDGNQYVDFYSIAQQTNLTIQGRALPFEQKDSVSLGYRSTIKGEFQISIDQKDGKLANQQVFLEDQLVKVLHDLKTPYSFETEIGTFNDRFVLRYEDKNAIIEDIDDLQLTAVSIATKDKKIDIKTTESAIDKVYIYDFSGNLVYSDVEINATATVISNLLVDHSALIVHVLLENGKKTVKKIMY